MRSARRTARDDCIMLAATRRQDDGNLMRRYNSEKNPQVIYRFIRHARQLLLLLLLCDRLSCVLLPAAEYIYNEKRRSNCGRRSIRVGWGEGAG